MKEINVAEIAERLHKIQKPYDLEEIEKLVNEKFNGRKITLDQLPSEIMMMVAHLVGKIRAQDRMFMIDLVQSVADELQKQK